VNSLFCPAALACFLLFCSCADRNPVDHGPSPVGPDSIRLADGTACFLAGMNYPWHYYGHDFGEARWKDSAWTPDGIGTPQASLSVDSQFAFLESKGVRFLRGFLFCDGRASPEFDSSGFVAGFDSFFFADVDSLLRIAGRHSIRFILVLLDYLWLDTACIGDGGVRLGGHPDVVLDSLKRLSFIENALRPLFLRYGASPEIAAWEIMNEPEWAVSELGGATRQGAVSLSRMQRFVRECADLAEELSGQPVTLGCSKSEWLSHWTGAGLDFYQFHSYTEARAAPPFTLKSDLGLDRGVVLGEFPVNNAPVSLDGYLASAWDYGYAGALGWSVNGKDAYSGFTSPGRADEFASWATAHSDALAAP